MYCVKLVKAKNLRADTVLSKWCCRCVVPLHLSSLLLLSSLLHCLLDYSLGKGPEWRSTLTLRTRLETAANGEGSHYRYRLTTPPAALHCLSAAPQVEKRNVFALNQLKTAGPENLFMGGEQSPSTHLGEYFRNLSEHPLPSTSAAVSPAVCLQTPRWRAAAIPTPR